MSEQLQAEGQHLQLFRDESLGSGAYGKVCKAKLNELPCAAKLLHAILFESDDPHSPTIRCRFVQECQLLQNMRHPNVVQYLGMTHDPQSGLPILLMELLDGNLTDFLEHSDGPIPYYLQVNLWYDIALALAYLHSKRIIHRDLSGNNVLLIAGRRAKVTDFGMSKLTNGDATKCRLTHCPGNAAYMSPEALIEPPVYGESLDVFSSGVVAVQTITRKFPNPAPSMMRCDDPNSPLGFSVALIPEVERRKDHINSVDVEHPMLPAALRCLSDREQDRPSAQELCCQLATLKEAPAYAESMQHKSPQARVREQEQQIQELKNQVDNERQQNQEQCDAVQRLQNELRMKEKGMREQEQQIQELQKQVDNERQQNREQCDVVQRLQNELRMKERGMQEQEQQIQELQKQIDDEKEEQHQLHNKISVNKRKMQVLGQKIQEQKLQNREQEKIVQQLVHEQQQAIDEQQQQLEVQQSKNQQMQAQITKSERNMQVLKTRLHEKSQELQLKKQQLWTAKYNLQQNTEELQQRAELLQQETIEFHKKTEELQRQLQQALQGHLVQELQLKIKDLEVGMEENRGQRSLIEQLPPAEKLPHCLTRLIEEGFQEWERHLCKFSLFCGHPSSGELVERKLEIHKNMILEAAKERAYKVLELEKYGVQLERCQLLRYNKKSGTLGKPFDEQEEMPFGEMVDGPQSCLSFDLHMEIQIDPATLPQHEQVMRAARVIYTNYSLLWQHLDASQALPRLMERSVISESEKKEVESYQQSYGQNAVIIDAILTAEHTAERLLTICDTLQATPGKEHIAQHLIRDYKRQPLAVRVPHSHTTGNTPLLSEVSFQFQNLQKDVVDLLVQCPNALTQLKQCLASLVLPLGDGKVASLVDPGSYEAANTIPEFFMWMAPYWNCLSTPLLSLLLEASGCKPAAAKLAEFEEVRASCGSLIFCTHRASRGELKSVHSLPCDQFRFFNPAVFTDSWAATEQNKARITAEVCKPLLHVSCYYKLTTAVCSFFRLPIAALVFAGCSDSPLALCWLVSRDLLPYMKDHNGGTTGERLLAEQEITQVAFGDRELLKCSSLKEVELFEASKYGLLETIPVLLTSVCVNATNSDGHTALYIASDNGHDQVVELLLRREADVNHQTKEGWTALFTASRNGHYQIVELLLRRGAHVNHQTKDGWTPLLSASFNGHQNMVELLLIAGANPDIQEEAGSTPLYIASQEGHDQVVELLLQAGANVEQETEDGRTPLWIASFHNHQRVVELLLAAGANPDLQEKDGQTALYVASDNGRDQVVELLLRRGADVNHQTKSGTTPLWTASFDGHQRVVELLLIEGANPDIQEETGSTPLYVASQEGHYHVVELLLQAGANVEQETENGRTALYTASYNGHEHIVELLLRREADVNHQTKFDQTPLTVARSQGCDHIVQLLLEANRTTIKTPITPPPKSPTAANPTSPISRFFKFWK